MRSTLLLLSLSLSFSFLSTAQTKWLNYANDQLIQEIALEDNTVWVAAQGGLVKINQITGEKETYQPWNSDMRGISLQSITVGPDGTKWIGTSITGLASFKDEQWEYYQIINTGDTLYNIRETKLAPNGDLWFLNSTPQGTCTECPLMFSFDGNTFTRHDENFPPMVSNYYPVVDYSFTSEGDVWACNYFSVFKYDGEDVLEKFDSTNSPLLDEELIKLIEVDGNNNIWIGTHRTQPNTDQIARILKYDGSTWTVEKSYGPGWWNYSMFQGNNNDMWFNLRLVGSPESTTILHFDGQGWTEWQLEDMTGVPYSYNGPLLINIDDNNNWWTLNYSGIHEDKLFVSKGSNWTGFDTQIFPTMENYFDCVAFDCENRTWMGVYGGANVFDGINWVEYDEETLGSDGSLRSITLDENTCDLWFAFYSGQNGVGFVRYDGENFFPYNNVPDQGASAFKVLPGQNGTLWVATSGDGLGRFNGSDWTWYNENNSPISDHIFDISIDQSGNIWAATYSGLFRFDGESDWQVFNSSNSPLNNVVHWVFIDDAGMVWAKYDLGIASFNGSNWSLIPVPGQNISINDMTQDVNNNYWLSDMSNGIYFWDGVSFVNFNIYNSDIISNYSTSIEIDPFGNKWIVHSTGISVYNENGISNQITSPTPGASGTVYFDYDQDGQIGPDNEPGMPGQKVWLQPQNLQGFTNAQGKYTFYPPPGEYKVEHIPVNPYVPTSPSPLNFEMQNEPVENLDFGIWAAHPPDSVSLDLTAGFARCNLQMNLWANFCNYGILDTDGNLEINFDPKLTYISAFPQPTSIQGNTIVFEFEDLPYYNCEVVKMVFQVPGVDQVDEELFFSGTAISGTGALNETQDETSAIISCSYDPNDKKDEAVGESMNEYSLLGDALDYTIRFQNKGNDTAFIVIIRDTLSPNLDHSTFQLLGNSHNMETLLDDNGVLTFTFRNINLLWADVDEAGSQGFVKYRISPKENLPDPTIIENTAYIYFDFNPAIVTNTTENILVENLPVSSVSIRENNSFLNVYPNPSPGHIWVEIRQPGFASTPIELTLYDLAGRQIIQKKMTAGKMLLENLPSGFYILKGNYGGYTESMKIVVSPK